MPKENNNKISSINVNVNNSSKKPGKRKDVLDLSVMVKEKEASKEERRPRKLKKIKRAPIPKVQSIPNNVSLGLVNKEKKLIYVSGVTFFMALICVLWAFNLDKLYSAESSKNAAPLIEMQDLVDFDAHLNERMAEVRAGLEKLTEEDNLLIEESKEVSSGQRSDSIISNYTLDEPDASEEIPETASTGEFKAIDLKKIIEDIRNMNEEEQAGEVSEE